MVKKASSMNFSKAAGVYDNTRVIPDHIMHQAIIILENNNHISKKKKLLDIGCGTGQLTKYFAENGYFCTGIDISAEMLEIARQKKINNAEFLIGDAVNIPFKDQSFDICIASKLFLHIENWQDAIKETIRVISDQGCFVYINEIGYFSNDVRKYFRMLADKKDYKNRFLGEYDLDKIAQYIAASGLKYKRYKSPQLSWKKEISFNEAYNDIENRSFAEFWMIPENEYNEMLLDTSNWIKEQKESWNTRQEMNPELILDVFWK